MPSRPRNWHEHYYSGETWFAEIIELARHNPKEAYHGMRLAALELVRYIQYGHAQGFFDLMTKWALTAILEKKTTPNFPFASNISELSRPPLEGMEYHLSKAVPQLPNEPAQEKLKEDVNKAIYNQAWEDAIDCLRLGFALRRRDAKQQQLIRSVITTKIPRTAGNSGGAGDGLFTNGG